MDLDKLRLVGSKTGKVYFSENELEELGIRSAAAFRNDRWKGKNIFPYHRVGKRILYHRDDIIRIIEAGRVDESV